MSFVKELKEEFASWAKTEFQEGDYTSSRVFLLSEALIASCRNLTPHEAKSHLLRVLKDYRGRTVDPQEESAWVRCIDHVEALDVV